MTERYTETYEYDPAGNMLALRYMAASGPWARHFGMGDQAPAQWQSAPNNQLTSLKVGTNTPAHSYQFDANGNLTQQNSERHHSWNHADRMVGYRVQTGSNSPASIEARYLYGADGMRVKKWVRKQQGQVNTTVYVDGAFEHHRQSGTAATAENNTFHVMDNQSRIALVRVGAPLDARDSSPQVQYHLGDHLGSNHVVLGGGNVASDSFINREEYFPYGETSFGSFGKKRYRYSGKERDEESGLYYFGARYLTPWLARWVSCDPAGIGRAVSLYAYVTGNPLNLIDTAGLSEAPPPDNLRPSSSSASSFRPKTEQQLAAEAEVNRTKSELVVAEERVRNIEADIETTKSQIDFHEKRIKQLDNELDSFRVPPRDRWEMTQELNNRRERAASLGRERLELEDRRTEAKGFRDRAKVNFRSALTEEARAHGRGGGGGDDGPFDGGTRGELTKKKGIFGKVGEKLFEIGIKIVRRAAGPAKILAVGLAVEDASSQWEEHGIVKGTIFNIADYIPVVSAAKGIGEGVVDLTTLGWDIYDHYEYGKEIK